jgi:hypothetical protein
MNWLKKNILEWALNKVKDEGRKNIGPIHVGALGATTTTRDESYRSDPLSNCEQLRFTIINVDNGTLVRMETHRPEDEYTVRQGGPRRGPPTFIVKDGENVQDVVVRLLGIAALERS